MATQKEVDRIAFLLAVVAVAVCVSVAAAAILEPESPKVACIKARGHWEDGSRAPGWSGTCTFKQAEEAK